MTYYMPGGSRSGKSWAFLEAFKNLPETQVHLHRYKAKEGQDDKVSS